MSKIKIKRDLTKLIIIFVELYIFPSILLKQMSIFRNTSGAIKLNRNT